MLPRHDRRRQAPRHGPALQLCRNASRQQPRSDCTEYELEAHEKAMICARRRSYDFGKFDRWASRCFISLRVATRLAI
jgi:hypothetical protein